MAGLLDETPLCWFLVQFTHIPQGCSPPSHPPGQHPPPETAKPGDVVNTSNSHILERTGHSRVENLKPNQRNLDQLDSRKR